MALTVGSLAFDIAGVTNVAKGTLAFDASYPTDGESLTPAMIGLQVIDNIRIDPKSGYTFDFDYTNYKVLAYRSAGFTPAGTVAAPTFTGSALAAHRHSLYIATGGTDATGTRINSNTPLGQSDPAATIVGIATASGAAGGVVDITAGTPAGSNSAPGFTGAAVAAAALIQVANATDLSTLTGVRFRAEGA